MIMQQRPRPARSDDSQGAALYERYASTVFTYLRRRLPSREDAEDVMLEVFLAAFERSSLVGLAEEEQGAWLRQVTRNKLIDHYRRANYRSSVPLDGVEDALYDEALDPERLAMQHEEERRLHAAVSQLPPAAQEVLRLRFGNGLRCVQIASMQGKREGAVRMTLSRALNLLRSLYTERQGGR